MKRREFLAGAGGGLAPAAWSGQVSGSLPTRTSRPKNVLLLISDQHKPDVMGWAGDANAITPNLDELAKSGTAFRSAYCANPVCAPSRASIVTGLYTHHHGVFKNDIPWRTDLQTFGHYFSRAGYLSGLIGKAHFGDGQTHGFDLRLDFNEWFQYLGPKIQLYVDVVGSPNGGCGFPEVPALWETGDPWKERRNPATRGHSATGRLSQMNQLDHFDEWVARESVRFLKNYGGKRPFFLVSSFLKPHAPFTPPERFIDPRWKESLKLPESYGKVDLNAVPRNIRDRITNANQILKDPAKAHLRLQMYYGCIAHVDECIGRVIQAVKDAGLLDDTVIVYTADHGDMCGEHGLWDKFVFYDASAGIPLIFRAPGITRPGTVCQAPVSQVALAPTLLELCGIPIPPGLDETSLTPFLRDPSNQQDRPVFSEFSIGGDVEKYMIRRGDWKYSYYMGDTPELYDLRNDPAEMKNLAGSSRHRDAADRLQKEVLAWRSGGHTPV